MQRLKSQAGFTITELIAVISLSGIMMAAAAMGFGTFFTKFEEMNRKTELQRGAFNCLQKIKNGIQIGSGTNLKFQGIATSDSIAFVGTNAGASSKIILYPPASDYTHQNDFISIYHDGKFVRATYLDGTLQPPAPLYLYPGNTRGNETEVTRLRFSKANTAEPITKVVWVELEARVKLKENRYMTVSYTTRMALSMK